MESSFWIVIFPFLIWLFPNTVYKVEDRTLVEKLQTEKTKQPGGSYFLFITVISYTGGIVLAPLVEYFNLPIPPLFHVALLVFALILIPLIYFSISRSQRKKLYNDIELETLYKVQIKIRPSSFKQFINIPLSYLVIIGIIVFLCFAYIETQNIIGLLVASLAFFGLLLLNRKMVKEGKTNIRFEN